MKLVLRYLRSHIGMFLLSTFFLTVEAVADLLQPTLMSYIVDRGIETMRLSLILRYGAIMLAIALAGAVGAVILIEDGRIDERGSHEALMAQNGKYAQMYRMQSGLADE